MAANSITVFELECFVAGWIGSMTSERQFAALRRYRSEVGVCWRFIVSSRDGGHARSWGMWTVEDNTTGRHDPMAHFADSWWMHPDLLITVASISVGGVSLLV